MYTKRVQNIDLMISVLGVDHNRQRLKAKVKGKYLKRCRQICRILQNYGCFRIFQVFLFYLQSRNFYTK